MTSDGGQQEETSYRLPPPREPQAAGRSDSDSSTSRGDDGATQAGAGRLVGGRYRLLERLGSGGMGTVWRARDQVVDRDVAIKEPRVPDHFSQPERSTAFLRMQCETRAAARNDHPSVVAIFDVVTEDDRPCIVMELVRGRSLAELLDEGTLPPTEAARVAEAVLGALVAAHEAGVLHRDVKPGNVMIGRHDRVVLTDFGIAQVEGEQKLTETGAFIGSPEYIAPERVLGRRPGPESDVWSLGVLLYQAVEGVSPFRRQTTPSTLQAVLLAELPPPQHSAALTAVITGLLRKAPEERLPATAAAQMLHAVAHPPARPAPTREATVLAGRPAAGRSRLITAGEDRFSPHWHPATGRLPGDGPGGVTEPAAPAPRGSAHPFRAGRPGDRRRDGAVGRAARTPGVAAYGAAPQPLLCAGMTSGADYPGSGSLMDCCHSARLSD